MRHERVAFVTAQDDESQPYPQGPPGTKPSPSDRYFQDLTYHRAKNALLLGLLSFFCCGFLTGVPAIVIGLLGLRDIRESNGRLRGRGSAIVGIVLGVLGTFATTGAAAYQVAYR
jgi:uncharacterized protein DUF4190